MPVPIEITFLGTGSAIPAPKRRHPAVLFHREADYFLFDCGEGTQLALMHAGVSPVKIGRVFISHWHADHFAGLLPLIETLHMQNRKEPLYIYGPDATFFVNALLELSYWGVGFELRAIEAPIDEQKDLLKTESYSVVSLPVRHSVPAVGYFFKEKSHWKIDLQKAKRMGLEPGPVMSKLHSEGKLRSGKRVIMLKDVAMEVAGRKIAYSGDTLAYEPFFKAVAGSDLLIHDATFIEPIPERSHASVREAAEFAKKYSIRRLVLTHISHRYSDVREQLREARAIFKNTTIAYDGLRIKI